MATDAPTTRTTMKARSPSPLQPMHATPSVEVETRADGTRVLRSRIALPEPYTRCLGEWLERWARETPERSFLVERGHEGRWIALSYAEARRRVVAIATWLLGQRLSAERPVLILSDNSIEHGLLTFAAMHIGVPTCALSPGVSLLSKDHAKLKANVELLRPGVIYADPVERFMPAIDAVRGLCDCVVVAGGHSREQPGTVPFAAIEAASDDEAAVMAAFARITPDTIAKFLFTSGSVGAPKAVINTQRMLCSNQEAKALMWPGFADEPLVLVEWLPWSHTFGGNHDLNLVLRWGGTLYIDDGKPTPDLLARTMRNLKEVSPTIYLNVPRGYEMMLPLLREDAELRANFFRRLRFIFYAAAALPHHVWAELKEMARTTTGRDVLMVSCWGATETAPMCTDSHFEAVRSGVIGVPIPGTALKLVPSAGKLEVRVKGPNIFPGYWKQPELSAKSFDDEGYYMIGDALKFVDEARPELGLLFDGRVSEDFKLLTGTWVHVGALRLAGIDAMTPVAQDIVVTGHNRDEIGFLVFPNIAECRRVAAASADTPLVDVLRNPAVRDRVRQGIQTLKKAGGGSSTYPARVVLLGEPPSAEAGEITDKGYINQRNVLTRRADLVESLYVDVPDDSVIGMRSAT